MFTTAETKLKTFRIEFKMYFGENSDYGSVHYRARSKENALKRLAKENRINVQTNPDYMNWRWWDDGQWLYKIHSIKEVSSKKCPDCNGTGEIDI